MKTEIREVYKCDHCNKMYQIKSYALKHEKSCSKNPENERACLNCPFLEMKETTIYHDTGHGEREEKINLFHCEKIGSFLYPPKVEHKNNAIELEDDTNKPMLKTCEIKNKEEEKSDLFWDTKYP